MGLIPQECHPPPGPYTIWLWGGRWRPCGTYLVYHPCILSIFYIPTGILVHARKPKVQLPAEYTKGHTAIRYRFCLYIVVHCPSSSIPNAFTHLCVLWSSYSLQYVMKKEDIHCILVVSSVWCHTPCRYSYQWAMPQGQPLWHYTKHYHLFNMLLTLNLIAHPSTHRRHNKTYSLQTTFTCWTWHCYII